MLRNENLLQIVHHRDQYVIISENKLFTSKNQTSWDCQYENIDGSFSGVCSNDNLIIAVIRGKAVLVSENGREWERHRLPFGSGTGNICFGNGQFVIAGDPVLISTDGVRWHAPRFRMPMLMNWACWADGRFFAVGPDGAIGYAQDVRYWNCIKLDWAVDFHRICFGRDFFGKERFVALSASEIFASGDADPQSSLDWKRGSIFGDFTPNAAVCANGHFIVVGNDGATARSITGLVYNPTEDSSTSCASNLNDVIYANGLLTAVGDHGTVLISIVGEKWEILHSGLAMTEETRSNAC